MKILLIAIASVILADAAFAHSSLAPHDHPHGPSTLLSLDTLVFALAAVVFLALAVRAWWRQERP